ncbi:MAG: hypothetical protein JKX76_04060 [Colwellia sp.]|nr:hypothetical protein [Colwellia sp.]
MIELVKDILCSLAGCADCGSLKTCEFFKFGIISMIFGGLYICGDFSIFKLTGSSPRKIGYVKGLLFVFVFWIIGSFIVGYVGAATRIIDIADNELLSALFVGVSWQFILSKWARGKLESEDEQPENAT